ncbi:peptidase S24/S26A/S26B/S26C [Vararia minispora EC-137]|uniref:Peptidase S24/S26A/S26B/S26C n=1 Tax=Vararia minispora EC-137 TaxID=1314806 RepID=A0ACB8QPY8_9AGAM|nr:peptidase S24/S26A/S26B/S26C [Vararia minispora EC-137]
MVFCFIRNSFARYSVLRRITGAIFFLPLPYSLVEYGFVVQQVNGISMQPTLNPDLSKQRDVVLFDRFSITTLRHYRRGDIVMVRSPYDPKRIYVKRLIALPGDVVETLAPYPQKKVTVPEGHCWIEGDRSMDSEDSNTLGPLPLALIEARLVTVIMPFTRALEWARGWGAQTGTIRSKGIVERVKERKENWSES